MGVFSLEQRWALGEREPVWALLGSEKLAKGFCSKKLGMDTRFLGAMEGVTYASSVQ